MKIIDISVEQFDVFAKNYSIKSIYQTSNYGECMDKENYTPIYLGLVDNDTIVAATLVLVSSIFGKFKYAVAPHGFLLDYNDKKLVATFTKQIKKYLGKRNIMAIKVNPLIIKTVFDKKGQIIYKNSEVDEIQAYFKKLGYYHFGYNNYFEALKPRFHAVIDLDKPVPELFHNQNKEHRNKTRKASNRGIKIYKGDRNYLKILFEQTKKKYARNLSYYEHLFDSYNRSNMIECYFAKINSESFLKQYRALYDKELVNNQRLNERLIHNAGRNNEDELNQKLNSDAMLEDYKRMIILATKFLKEHPEGLVMASALIIKYDKEVYLYISGYDTEYKNFSANHLLIWKLIEKYSLQGYTKFNLGGISAIDIKENKYKGLNDFKLGFGAKAYEYLGDFELITNHVTYFMYQNAEPFKKLTGKNKKKNKK